MFDSCEFNVIFFPIMMQTNDYFSMKKKAADRINDQ